MFKRTHELPQIQLTDPIWTIEHVAAALRIGERAARDVIKRPGFPSPSRLGSGPTSRLYWLAQDVLDYMRTQATRPPTMPASRTLPAFSPTTPVLPAPRNRGAGALVTDDEEALAVIESLQTTRQQVTR